MKLDTKQLEAAMVRRIERNTELSAELAFAAIPALAEHYARKCELLFELAARPLIGRERSRFRTLLAQALQTGFEASAHAKVVVRCRNEAPPSANLGYEIGIRGTDIADVYAGWLRGPSEPYFGARPDARVMEVARGLTGRGKALDIGAGDGRNALPLARLGFDVDAVDMTPGFVTALRAAAHEQQVALNAIEGDAFDPELPLTDSGYALVVASEVVSSHARDVEDLRTFFELSARKLTSSGMLVCNVFVAREGYAVDALARQSSPALLSTLFSRADIEQASAGLPLSLISDDSCSSYEQAHSPSEAWPPTRWFAAWAQGGNLFDLPTGQAPCVLRWLVYRRA